MDAVKVLPAACGHLSVNLGSRMKLRWSWNSLIEHTKLKTKNAKFQIREFCDDLYCAIAKSKFNFM